MQDGTDESERGDAAARRNSHENSDTGHECCRSDSALAVFCFLNKDGRPKAAVRGGDQESQVASQSKFRMATWNCSSLSGRLDEVLETMGAHDIDVMVLQETRIPADCVSGVRSALKRAGCTLIVTPPVHDAAGRICGGVAVIANWGVSSVSLQDPTDAGNVLIFCTCSLGKSLVECIRGSVVEPHWRTCRGGQAWFQSG